MKAVLLALFLLADTEIFMPVKYRQWVCLPNSKDFEQVYA
jgi:hypothetical protein